MISLEIIYHLHTQYLYVNTFLINPTPLPARTSYMWLIFCTKPFPKSIISPKSSS